MNVALKLPQEFGSINTESVDSHSSILSDELVENSIFTIPDLSMKRVFSPCRREKIRNQNISNSNNHALKHHKSHQTGIMPLPGSELLRPLSSRDQINKLEIGKFCFTKSSSS